MKRHLLERIWEQDELSARNRNEDSTWSSVHGIGVSGTNGIIISVDELNQEKASAFRSEVSYPHALFFRKTRTDSIPQSMELIALRARCAPRGRKFFVDVGSID